tara:strand:+ start:2049 stop:2240 length:192 start_codon:yes stop_codon:yes gene_type:complete
MYWVKEYCEYFKLTISLLIIRNENNNAIGTIDMYNDIVDFGHNKYMFGDFAIALLNNCNIHTE